LLQTNFSLCFILEAVYGELFSDKKNLGQIVFTCMVYPALILAYMGQAAYLCKHHIMESDYMIRFYVSVPGKLFSSVLIIRDANHSAISESVLILNAYNAPFQRKLGGPLWQLLFLQQLWEAKPSSLVHSQ
jgi:hypothetical protein